MRISEFAKENQVTTKLLRYYDNIGLLKPVMINEDNGYREYDKSQSILLGWILIFREIGFSLSEIKELISKSIIRTEFIDLLEEKRALSINSVKNENSRQMQINKLISIIEREGIDMNTNVNLSGVDVEDINELKRNIPYMDLMVEETRRNIRGVDSNLCILRTDLALFKSINDDFGYDVGDRVIVTFYSIILDTVKNSGFKYSLGRAGGDEFVISLLCEEKQGVNVAEKIVSGMKSFDFDSIGCNRSVGCYIALVSQKTTDLKEVRELIDQSIPKLYKAKKMGVYSIT